MFYLFKHTLIITEGEISVLAGVGIRWTLGRIRKGLVGNCGSYNGDIVYFVLFKKYILGLIQLFDDQV